MIHFLPFWINMFAGHHLPARSVPEVLSSHDVGGKMSECQLQTLHRFLQVTVSYNNKGIYHLESASGRVSAVHAYTNKNDNDNDTTFFRQLLLLLYLENKSKW